MPEMKPFQQADRALTALKKKELRRLDDCKNALLRTGFDELNVIKRVTAMYKAMESDNRKQYLALFIARYLEVLAVLEAKEPKEDTLDELAGGYITGVLSAPNEVTKYAYDTEVYRKRDRAIEAVNAMAGSVLKQIELDKHIKYWYAQTGYYADIVCEGANREALKAAGVKRVIWHTEEDMKVCKLCEALDGKVFDIDKIPVSPHPRCRCYVTAENGEKVFENPGDSGIMEPEERGMADRNFAMSLRKPTFHILTDEEIEIVKEEAKAIEIPVNILLFNEGSQTGFRDVDQKITIRGDVFPDNVSKIARDSMSVRAALAHEYYGHFKNHPSEYAYSDWRDEFRASYDAAINTPNLTDEDRRWLMLDAYDRAKAAGEAVDYTPEARRIIYGL